MKFFLSILLAFAWFASPVYGQQKPDTPFNRMMKDSFRSQGLLDLIVLCKMRRNDFALIHNSRLAPLV